MSNFKSKGKIGLKIFLNVVLPVVDMVSDFYFTGDLFLKGQWKIGLISGMVFEVNEYSFHFRVDSF